MKRVKMNGWAIDLFEIAPKDAQHALDSMTEKQRTSSESAIRNLVSEINDNRFGISNDAMVKTESDIWLNGKHRCQAIIRTGKAQVVAVMTVPNDAASKILRVMDCGVVRSVANMAEMLCGVGYSRIVAAVAKNAIAHSRGLITCQGCYASTNRTAQDKFISRDAVLDYINSHAAQLQETASTVSRMSATYGLFGACLAAFPHYMIARKYSQKEADAFFLTLFSGKGDRADSVEPLRRAVIKNMASAKKVSSAVKSASVFKAFAAWKNGTIPARGFVALNDSFPKF